jgi:hypothetical protein
VIQKANEDSTKMVEELKANRDANQAKMSTEDLAKLNDTIAQALSVQAEANQKKLELDKQYQEDKLKIENSFKLEDLQKEVNSAHEKGDNKTEHSAKQNLLTEEYNQAIAAARKKGEDTTKIDQEFKLKQRKLDKDQLDAQAENQKQYLKSLDSLSSAVIGIFGKNSQAAKIAFKAHQAASAAQVIVDTERSIMGIWAADSGIPFVGVPKAIAETAIVAATGATSLASILKQKPNFASGGQFVSDGRGAVLPGYSRTDNTNAYLRSGEAVVVSEAMRNPWARNLVSAVNVAFGGRDFSVTNPGRGYAIGGIFTDGGNANRYYSQPMNDVKDLANTLAYQMINNFPPVYVDVKDINSQQNILAQTVNRVNL